MNLHINGLYQMSDSSLRIRILETNIEHNQVAVIALDRRLARPTVHNLSDLKDDLDTLSLLPVTETPEYLPEGLIDPKKRAYRDKMMAIISPLVKDGPLTMLDAGFWRQILIAAEQADLAPNTIWAAITRYFQGGCTPNALTPNWHQCGRKYLSEKQPRKKVIITSHPGAYSLSAVDINNIIKGAEKFYVSDATWKDAHDRTLEKFYCSGIEIKNGLEIRRTLPEGQRPSFWQFFRIGNKHLGTIGRLKNKLGKRGYELTGRGKPGSQAADALLPGLVAEIDWTFTDIVAVRRKNRLSIGRLVVYAIVDRASGIVLSIYVTLETGKWSEAAKAILICLEDKVDLCAQHGVTITPDEWPVRHLFDTLVSDKGEIDSWKATPIGTGLGIKLIHCPSKRPDTKGTIEAFMKAINYWLLRKLPGATTGLHERCTEDPRVTAIYDFDEINTLLHAFTVYWNQRLRKRQPMTKGMVAAGISPVPNLLWQWAEQSGCLRAENLENARMQLLEWHEVSVTEYGFSIYNLKYVIPDFDSGSPSGIESNEWLAKARIKRWKISLAIDPSTVGHVWFRHAPRGKPPVLIKCLIAPLHGGLSHLSWEEYRLYREKQKTDNKNYREGELRNAQQELEAIIRSVTSTASQKTETARDGLSKKSQTTDIDHNRRSETAERSIKPQPENTNAKDPEFTGFFNPKLWGTDEEN